MKISMFTGGFVQTNGYLLETPEGNLLIDAPEGILPWVKQRGVRIDAVLLTHQHYDHVTDAAALKANGSPLYAFTDHSRKLTLEAYGLPVSVVPYQIDQFFDLTKKLSIAGLEITLAHVPGHSADSVTLYIEKQGVLFSGDTLFAGSIGRPDLPGGDQGILLSGIAKHLMTLPPETRVFPGHGPDTTIGEEARSNPYL